MLIIRPITKRQLAEFMVYIRKTMAVLKIKQFSKDHIAEIYCNKLFESDDVSQFRTIVLVEVSPILINKPYWRLHTIYRFNQRLVEYCSKYRTENIDPELTSSEIERVLIRIVEAIKFRYTKNGHRGRNRKYIKKQVYDLFSEQDLELLNRLTFNEAFTMLEQFKVLEPVPKTNLYKFPLYKTLKKLKLRIRRNLELL